MVVNIRLGRAGADRQSRRWRVLRYRSRALPLSFADGVREGSAGCPAGPRRGGAPGKLSRRSRWHSSRRRRRPSSRSRRPIQSLATQHGQPNSVGENAHSARFGTGPLAAVRRRCRRWLLPERLAARSGNAARAEAEGSVAGAALSVRISAGLASINSSTARPFSVIRHPPDARPILASRYRERARERRGAWSARPSRARSSPESPYRA